MVSYDVYLLKRESLNGVLVWAERPIYLHGAPVTDRLIAQTRLSIKASDESTFDFTIAPTHPLYGEIAYWNGFIVVKKNGKVYYKGRTESVETDLKGVKSVKTKGNLAFFKDSFFSRYLFKYVTIPEVAGRHMYHGKEYTPGQILPRWKNDASPLEMFRDVMAMHCAQTLTDVFIDSTNFSAVENPYGVQVKNTSGSGGQQEGLYITRDQSALIKTWDWMKNELIQKTDAVITCTFGATKPYSMTVHVSGPKLKPATPSSGKMLQAFRVGKNILDRKIQINTEALCTVFLPIGSSNGNIGKTINFSFEKLLSGELTEDTEIGYASGLTDDQLLTASEIIIGTTPSGDQPLQPNMSWQWNSHTINGRTYHTKVPMTQTMDGWEEGTPSELLPRDVDVALPDSEGVLEIESGLHFKFVPPFIEWVEGVEKYGRILKTKSWSSASRSKLQAYAPAEFKKMIYNIESVTLTAADLRLVDDDYDSPEVGYAYHIISDGFDRWLPCLETSENILNPTDIKFTFSRKATPLTSRFRDIVATMNYNPVSVNQKYARSVNGVDITKYPLPVIYKRSGYTTTGAQTAFFGETYSFTVTADQGKMIYAGTIKMNGVERPETWTAPSGESSRTVNVENVTGSLIIEIQSV